MHSFIDPPATAAGTRGNSIAGPTVMQGDNKVVLPLIIMTAIDESPRERILSATAALLATGGRGAVSTRAVSSAAGVQPPTIYRHFGEMQGLLDEVAARGFADYVQRKNARAKSADPLDDLRMGWDLHVEFGLSHPAIYALMYGDPREGSAPGAAREAREILVQLVGAVAAAGRLHVSVDRAVRMIAASGVGVVLLLIATPAEQRDPELSSATREAVLAAITNTPPSSALPTAYDPRRPTSHAVALKAVLPEAADAFTPAELGLLDEWLNRLT